MQNLILCSAGFFFCDEQTQKWYVLGMSQDFDEVMLPTVTSERGEAEAEKAIAGIFKKFGLEQTESFTEVYRVREKESGAILLSFLVNPIANPSLALSELPTDGIEVLEIGKKCFQFRLWEINEFEQHVHQHRDPFTALVGTMAINRTFLKDNAALVAKLTASVHVLK